jgi:hypothetical protein
MDKGALAMKKPYWLFMLTFALVFYVMGAAFLEGFVNYRTWHLIGAAEFKAYHQALTPRVVAFLVAPGFLVIVLTLLLLRWRPPAVPRWGVWLSLALNLVVVIVSVTSQIPIQTEFDRSGMSLTLLDRLILMDWLRKVPVIINAILFLWMMAKVLGRAKSAETEG